jgi:hypothetical protein
MIPLQGLFAALQACSSAGIWTALGHPQPVLQPGRR